MKRTGRASRRKKNITREVNLNSRGICLHPSAASRATSSSVNTGITLLKRMEVNKQPMKVIVNVIDDEIASNGVSRGLVMMMMKSGRVRVRER